LYVLLADAKQKARAAFEQTNLAIDIRRYQDGLLVYLTEMNSLLDSFSSVTDYDSRFFVASASTRQVDVYRELQQDITASTLHRRSRLLLDKAQELRPPPTQETIHNLALTNFEVLVEMADLFERFGRYEEFDKSLRDQYISEAFKKLESVKSYTSQIQRMIAGEKPGSSKGLRWPF